MGGHTSFLTAMPCLKAFDFELNFLTIVQVAWTVASFPHLEGFALRAKYDCMFTKSGSEEEVHSTVIVGKCKPLLNIAGNEARIARYEEKFEELKKQYQGKEYREVFPTGS